MTTTRRATADDLPFLEEMFVAAADWRPGSERGTDAWRADPTMAKYLGGFPREGDVGVIAIRDREPVGAAWSRRFTQAVGSYGWVADDIPELTLGVVPGRRGEGVGTITLQALIAAVAGDLSLSVEPDNVAAVRLYRTNGFAEVGANGGAVTMLRKSHQ